MHIEDLKIDHHGRAVDATFYKPKEANHFPVVIFSHGYNGYKTDFEGSARRLATAGIGALCFTFCGGSTRDVSGFDTSQMTLFTEKEDLIAVIDKLKTYDSVDNDNIYLFGASQGGLVSALVAEEKSQDIKGLILLFPAFCIADDWTKRYENLKDIPESVEFWGMTLGNDFIETIHGFDIREHIGGFSKRVLILHGTQDGIVTIDYVKMAAEQYEKAELIIFENEGHGFSEGGNKKVEALTLEFVQDKT